VSSILVSSVCCSFIARLLGFRLRSHAQLAQRELLASAVLGVHDELPAFAVQRHRTVADLPEEEDRSARGLLQRQGQLVGLHLRLERLAQRVLGAEEAVGGHGSVDALMRAEVVVVAEEVRHALPRLGQVLGPGAVPQLLSDRLPQALALTQGLGMVRARDDVADALACQELLEGALPAPGEVLAALVGQDLLRLAVTGDAFQERLADEFATLLRRQLPAHDVAAEVVQEDRQVDAGRVAP
jgi:hypothetical protein